MLRFIGGLVLIFILLGVAGSIFGNRARPYTAAVSSTATETRPSAAAPVVLQKTWQLARSTSAIDDSPTVQLSLEADRAIEDRYGGTVYPTLLVWCRENRSGVAFQFGEHFMADLGSYGDITYRIDSKHAVTKHFRESTDNGALMLVSSEAIAFMKAMFGGARMVVRVTPYNERAVETTFTVANLETAVRPLRAVCHW